ncbi:MAG: BON domain-containing protein [Deltaproteobacteria bacterium]|nr:BON domain-containing protein [Deltaproteobacteria bacterium]
MNERNGNQNESRSDGRNGHDRDGNRSMQSAGLDQPRWGSDRNQSGAERGQSGRTLGERPAMGQRGGYEQRDFGGRGNERDGEYSGHGQAGSEREADQRSPDHRSNLRDLDGRSYGSGGGETDRNNRMQARGHYAGEGNDGMSGGVSGGMDGMGRPRSGRDGFSVGGGQQENGSRQGSGWGGSESGFGSQQGYGAQSSQGYGMGGFTSQGYGAPQSSQGRGMSGFEGGAHAQKSGKAPKNYTRSDERLREEICDALANSGHDWSEVEVQVSSGEVTLTGTVADRSEKLHAEHMADAVRGVNEVTNQLKIKRPEAGDSRSASKSSSMKDEVASETAGSRRRTA